MFELILHIDKQEDADRLYDMLKPIIDAEGLTVYSAEVKKLVSLRGKALRL